MKKLVGIVLLLLVVSAFVSADESKLFVVTRPITKIYVHRLGFKVVYLKNDLNLAEFYVPMSWFDEAGGKGTLIKGKDNAFPYFSIFWKEGKFFAIKLYTKQNLADESWGDLPNTEGIAKHFEVDEIQMEF